MRQIKWWQTTQGVEIILQQWWRQFKRKNNNKLYNANRDMASSSMHETTGFENQTRESIPTLRRPIKLVNMVNSFSYCSWITYKTQKVLKIKRYECTGLPRNSHFFVTYLLYKKISSFTNTKLAAELNILQQSTKINRNSTYLFLKPHHFQINMTVC